MNHMNTQHAPVTTTKAAHTPGPWRVIETADGKTYSKNWREIGPGIVGAASYTTNRFGEPEEVIGVRISNANARLIAAAPGLLEVLKLLRNAAIDTPALDSSSDWTALIIQADLILAQAEGTP